MSLNDTMIGLRAQLLRAGAAAPLNWWAGQPLAQDAILKRLFPATADGAALAVVARSAASLGLNGLTDALTLFDLGETRETLLRAYDAAPAAPLAAVDGASLASALLTNFPALASVETGELQWRENAVLNRVETNLVGLHDPLTDDDVRLVARALLDGLKYSAPGRYLQPVIVRT